MEESFQFGRLWRTVRPLQREQLLGRLTYELRSRAFRHVPPLLCMTLGRAPAPGIGLKLEAGPAHDTSRMEAAHRIAREGRAMLAGHDVMVRAWADSRLPKLVRYHLHYLDAARELAWAGAARGDAELSGLALELVLEWSQENPIKGSEGWEPYPVAARLQNLAHLAALAGPATPSWLRSLMALHARYLSAYPETHLQANHLLKDWVALALAGLLFDGSEAEEWRERGLAQLQYEISKQVLPDGGHYERSPMYHLLVLADLLDVRAFARARGVQVPWLDGLVGRMAALSAGLLHPDGEIPLFNDAVLGQAPSPASVFARLDGPMRAHAGPFFDAPHFGLSALRGEEGELVVVDSGPLGPGHQPGHAHSDTLSFELSVGGVRAVVNAGVDGYQSPNRQYFRSAAAHNTVTVGGDGPDELWSAFRVGGRCRVLERQVRIEGGVPFVTAALRAFQGWQQTRALVLVPGRALVVVDETSDAPTGAELCSRARLVPGTPIRFQPIWGVAQEAREAPYAPRFGSPLSVIEHAVRATGSRARLGYALLWGAGRVDAQIRGSTLHLTVDDQEFSVATAFARDLP